MTDFEYLQRELDNAHRTIEAMSESRNKLVALCPCGYHDPDAPVCLGCGGPKYVCLGDEVNRLRRVLEAVMQENQEIRAACIEFVDARNMHTNPTESTPRVIYSESAIYQLGKRFKEQT